MRKIAIICLVTLNSTLLSAILLAGEEELGLPKCEQIVGVDRYIEIGNTVLYTVKYLEENNYACSEYLGNANEVISCKLRSNQGVEILITVENGMVSDIDTLDNGKECTYFNIKEEPKIKVDR